MIGGSDEIAVATAALTLAALLGIVSFLATKWRRHRLEGAQERRIAVLDQRYLETFQQAPVGIAHFTLDLIIIRTNPKYDEILGYRGSDLIGVDVRTLIHPDDHEAFDLVKARLMAGNVDHRAATFERRFVRKDGAIVHLSVSGAVIRGEPGEPDYRVGFYLDVSERHAAEQELAQSEARFRSYIEHAPIAVLVADDKGRWIDCNPAAARLLGYAEKQIRGMPIATGIEDGRRMLDDLGSLPEDGILTAEYGFTQADGTAASIELSAVRLTPTRTLVYALDTTSRREAARELQERLRLQDQMMRIAASVPGILYAFRRLPDGSFQIPFASAGVEELLGLTLQALAADPNTLAGRVDAEDKPRLLSVIAASARDLSPLNTRFRYLHPLTGLRWIEGHALPRVEADGGVIWHGFATDITRSRQDAVALRDATAALANADTGIFVINLDGVITSVNASFVTLTGYSEEEAMGRPISILRSVRHDNDFYVNQRLVLERTGFWQSEIWITRQDGEIFPVFSTMKTVTDEDGNPTNCVGTFTDISKIKEQERALEHVTSHDALTGLPNRQVFLGRLGKVVAQSIETGVGGAVLFLGLDRFQSVNDSLGHPAGDEVLRVVADRLRTRLRDLDMVARLGGDEFAILLHDLASLEDGARVARALINQVLEPITLAGGQEIVIGASIGLTLFPSESQDVDELVKNADAALHQAKADGRGIHRSFSAEMTRDVAERFDLEGRLRRAIDRQEFVLHYQPLVLLADRSVRGAEALIRWEDPERGRVPPNQFIGLAEETGLIVPLGDWVLRTACAQMRAWRDAGVFIGTVSVNLSPIQFRQHDIVDRVGAILEATDLPGSALELEITEGALIGDPMAAQETLTRLKRLGVRLAIDDFGTGYSSLGYLKRFPIDKLKIDQSFVREIPRDQADMEIAGAVISLARSLGLESLAEGIETEEQLAFLRARGCEFGQGYLFGRPVPPEEFGPLSRLLAVA